MISEFVRLVVANIGRLTPFDYFLILVVAVFLSAGIYLILSSIYKQVISAQDKLIGIQDRTIQHHEKTVDGLSAAKSDLEAKYRDIQAELNELRHQLETEDKSLNERLNKLITKFGLLVQLVMVGRIGILQLHILQSLRVRASTIAPYGRLVDQTRVKLPTQIVSETDELSERVYEKLEVLRIYGNDGPDIVLPGNEVPEAAYQYLMGESERAKELIKADLDKTVPVVIEQLKRAQKQIGRTE